MTGPAPTAATADPASAGAPHSAGTPITGTAASAAPDEAVTGLINRIDWEPGSDLLRGTCHCGARHTCDDPIAMWAWLLGHPDGHRAEVSDD
ncbi:MAG TPA: hypothetical protein VFU65_04200 [Actinocrinis sp.]|nr:hypothetical protein [Actinocrinis sp.]